ncbi:MAG: excinuclease ABC subunit UvrC [Chloroflexi bacterium]|nr:excinuclease ABC subunit UvrC [Chloroflexota bacterium]
MKDADGTIIYVGKAAVLRNRVRSYFQAPEGLSPRIRSLVERIADFDYIIARNELEAFILESNYIKEHRPRYNVRLRDDKQYPYLRITVQEDYPRVERVRRVERDGARYFGPFASSKSLNGTLSLIRRLFPYRSCELPLSASSIDPSFRPCLEFHIHRCFAPCNGTISRAQYRQTIEQVCLFLEGRSERIVRSLEREMVEAAEEMEFERAARLRDQLRSVQRVIERQRVVSPKQEDIDGIGLARDAQGACVEIVSVRGGKVVGSDRFLIDAPPEASDAEIITAFLQQYYPRAATIPPHVLLPVPVEETDVLQEWLRTLAGRRVQLTSPQRGEKRQLIQLASENATQDLQEERARWLSNRQRTVEAAGTLGTTLQLPRFPHRIECYDNSNIQGSDPVAAMVVFIDGQPAKQEYRRFKIKTVQGPNDFQSMGEIIRRRFLRFVKDNEDDRDESSSEDSGWGALPDLVIVDGGKGQLNAACKALEELRLADKVPIVALAKQQEEIFLPDRSASILLPRTSAALHLVQRIRDETHRFAITFHRQQRQRSGMRSLLDSVTGIGPKRKQQLLRRFGSSEGVASASIAELTQIPGVTPTLAQRLKFTLGHV